MYSFHYNWDEKYFPNFKTRMREIYKISSRMSDKSTKVQEELKNDFAKIEDYYATILKLGYITDSNFSHILNAFLNLIVVLYLDKAESQKVNGFLYRGLVALSPEPGQYYGLTLDESKRIAVYHELGHQITAQNADDLSYFQKQVFNPKEVTLQYGNIDYNLSFDSFCAGFCALDEVVSENAAEAALAYRKKEPRKESYTFIHKILCPGREFKSNFYEYMELQDLVYHFAKNLHFLDCSESDDMNQVIDKLTKAMFSKDFCKKLFDEFYLYPEKSIDMMVQLICMGNIKNAKYAVNEDKDDFCELDVTKYYELFYRIQDSYGEKGRQEKQKNLS